MIVAMATERLETLEQVRGFLEGSAEVEYQLVERGGAVEGCCKQNDGRRDGSRLWCG